MLDRNIVNGEHELEKNSWVLSFVRRAWNAHGFLIIEGLDEKGVPIRKRAELGHMETGIDINGQMGHDATRGQIYYSDLSDYRIELMRQEQSDYICKTFILNQEEKGRLDEKIREDQKREIPYNLGGATKSSGFFGASLASSGSHESKGDLTLAALDRVREEKLSGQSSLAVLKPGHNCVSWAEEAIQYAKPSLNLTTGFGKYVVVVPHVEIGTSCVIL